MKKLIPNNTYLIKRDLSITHNTLSCITVLRSTNLAYEIRWENYPNVSITWELKKDFLNYYEIVENITQENHLETKDDVLEFNICNDCNGVGYFIGSNKICEICWGMGRVFKKNEYLM